MTHADEATCIALWAQGASYRELAAALGCPLSTVASRSAALVAQGKIQPRPRGGAYPSRRARARSGDEGGPSTVHPDTWELKQLKHSIRWTVYVPQAMREELQRRAAAPGQNPSLLVQEALARWLAEEA
jgi:DNA-binding transcriptional MocR family regulator